VSTIMPGRGCLGRYRSCSRSSPGSWCCSSDRDVLSLTDRRRPRLAP
jgi:hypothetical protein